MTQQSITKVVQERNRSALLQMRFNHRLTAMGLPDFLDKINKRSVKEWRSEMTVCRESTRNFVRNHGEVAAFSGFAAGICTVLFFRLVAWGVFVLCVAAGIIWLRAPEGRE